MSWSLKLGEDGGRVGADWVGPPSWSAQPLGWVLWAGDHVQYPAFVLLTSEVAVAVGFWSFCMLFIICHSCAHKQLFLIAYGFLVL